MTKAKTTTLFAVLPDGKLVTRNTSHPYTHMVASRFTGRGAKWGAYSWSSKHKTAVQDCARLARKFAEPAYVAEYGKVEFEVVQVFDWIGEARISGGRSFEEGLAREPRLSPGLANVCSKTTLEYHGKFTKAWLAGWDAANIAAPVVVPVDGVVVDWEDDELDNGQAAKRFPVGMIVKANKFSFHNPQGGTGLSDWEWNERLTETVEVRVEKSWNDYETGDRIIGSAVSDNLIKYLDRNAGDDRRIFLSEWDLLK